jgi:hypothetical protein
MTGEDDACAPASLTQLDAFCQMVHRTVQVVPFVEQLAHSHVRKTRCRKWLLLREAECLSVEVGRPVQASSHHL